MDAEGVEVRHGVAEGSHGLGLPLLSREASGDLRRRVLSEVTQELYEECILCREMPRKEDGVLERRLNSVELSLLGIGACIGAGIFVLTGAEARLAGPSVALSFLLAAASSVFNGMCFAELASRLPISGSAYLYAYCLLGELAALVLVANQLVDYHLGAATLARSLVAYVAQGLEQAGIPVHECVVGCQPFEAMPWLSFSLGAPAVLSLITLVVARGAETNAIVTSVMTVFKIAIVLFVIFLGSFRMDAKRLHPFFPNGFSATVQSAATLNYAFIGYDVIANAAEESSDPQRDIPVAMMVSLATCAVLYCCLCLVLCGMQDFRVMDTEAPVSGAFVQQNMVWVASMVDVGSFIGLTTGLLAGIYGQSRIYFAMARDEMLPKWLQRTPNCAAWCGGLAAVLASVLNVHSLASFLNIGVLFSYAVTAASVLLINSCHPRSEGFFLVTVGTAAGLMAVGQSPWAPRGTAVVAAVVLAASVAWAQAHRSYNCGPASSFRCPGLPTLPLVAMACNFYLAAELSVHAWLRMLGVSLLVVIIHTAIVLAGALDHHKRRSNVCRTVNAASPGLCRT